MILQARPCNACIVHVHTFVPICIQMAFIRMYTLTADDLRIDADLNDKENMFRLHGCITFSKRQRFQNRV